MAFAVTGLATGYVQSFAGCNAEDRRYIALASRARRGGRVAEGARLESVYTGNRIVGSNPTPSASPSSALVRSRSPSIT